MVKLRHRKAEESIEKETTPYSSILAWEIPWTEEPGGLPSMGSKKSGMISGLKHSHRHVCIKE